MYHKNSEASESITSIQRNRLLLAAERLFFLASLLEDQKVFDGGLHKNSISTIRKLATIVEDVAVNRSEQSICTRTRMRELILETHPDK